MPNVLAHNFAAHSIIYDPSPNVALGNVLPDFRGMYRDYKKEEVEIEGLSLDLDRGVQLHRRIDRAFNLQPETLEMTTSLTDYLAEAGIKPQAARLAAHMLADVMPDAALMRDHQALEDYRVLEEYVLYEKTALQDGYFPPEFTKMVCDYFEKDKPRLYRDPDKLAAIVQHRLGKRARKPKDKRTRTINPTQIPAMAEVIDAQAERIYRLGTAALTSAIEQIQPEYSALREV